MLHSDDSGQPNATTPGRPPAWQNPIKWATEQIHQHFRTAPQATLEQGLQPLIRNLNDELSKNDNVDAAVIAQSLDCFQWYGSSDKAVRIELSKSPIQALLEKEHARIVRELADIGNDIARIVSCFSVTTTFDGSSDWSIFMVISQDRDRLPLYRIIHEWVESKRESAPQAYALYKEKIRIELNKRFSADNRTVAEKLLAIGADTADFYNPPSTSATEELQQAINSQKLPRRIGFMVAGGIGVISIGVGVALPLLEANIAVGSEVMLSDVLLLSGAALALIGVIALLIDLAKGSNKDRAINVTIAILAGPAVIGASFYIPMLIANQMQTAMVGMEVTMPIGTLVGLAAGLALGLRLGGKGLAISSAQRAAAGSGTKGETQASVDKWAHDNQVYIVTAAGAATGALIAGVLPQATALIASEPMAIVTLILAASLLSTMAALLAPLERGDSV